MCIKKFDVWHIIDLEIYILIKQKENTREKDSAIQKRLSWNHGPQTQLQSEQSKLAAEFNRKFFR